MNSIFKNSLPAKQLNIKHEGSIWRDDTTCTPLPVPKLCRDDQASLAALLRKCSVKHSTYIRQCYANDTWMIRLLS